MKISQLYKQFTKVQKGIKKPVNKGQSKKTNIPKSKTGLWNKKLNKVIVPSNRITMKGPNGEKDFFKRPVLGKGLQTGKTVIMQPGKEYKFPGDREVLETRMQDGGLSRRQIYRDVSAEVDRQTEALNTPEYKKLLQTEFYGPGSEDMPVQDMIDARRLNLDQLRVDVPYMSFMNFGPSTHAKYKPGDHSILLKKGKYNPSFFRHELSHSLDSSFTPGANKVGDYFTQVLSQDLNRGDNASNKNTEYEYLSDPSEVKARLKALRDSSIDQGYQLLQPGYNINDYKEGFSPADKAQYQQLQDIGLSDDDINKYMYLFAKEDVAKQKIAQDGAEIPVDIDALYSRYQKDTTRYMQDAGEVTEEGTPEESLYNMYQWEKQPDNVTYKKVNQTSPTRYKFNSALSEGGDKETQMMQKWLNDTYNVYLPENGVLDTKTQSAIDRYVKNQNAVRRSEIDPNLFSGMPEGFSFRYDDKGNLQAKSASEFNNQFKDWKTVEKLNPTFAEFEDLMKRVPKYNQYYETIYDVDTKLRGEQQGPLTKERASELAALKQYQDLPEDYKKYLGQTLGNLPVVEGSLIYEGYSPNRIWTTPPSKDSRPWLGDSEAYDPETQPRYLYFISPKEGTKWTSEEIAAQEENMGCISGNCGDEYYNAGILAPKSKLELKKETPNVIPSPTGQTWNLGKQMLVEMLNNPEIMEYASKNNINLTDFAKEQYSPILAEALVAARDANFNDKGLVVPHSRDYSPVIQNPDEFNLAGYLPITMDMFSPSVSPDKKNKQRYRLNWADNREEYLRRAGVPEDQWDKVYIHTSPFPISEYQTRQYQEGGSIETSTEENPERMNPIEINVQRRPWWKRTLRKAGLEVDPQYRDPDGFAGQMARRLSDATGGENWYKTGNDVAGSFAQILTAPFTAPQLGMMYGLTGKVQTPSEAMDIQNPYGAFAVDAILEPATIVGVASAAPKLASKAAGSLAKLARKSATRSLDEVTRPALRITTPTSRVMDDVVRETSSAQPRQLDLFEGAPQSQTTTSRGFISGSDPNSVRVKSRQPVVNQSNFEMGSPKLSAEQREIARSMTPEEYRNTVTDVYGRLKPTAPDQRLPGVVDIPREEYIDIFNRNLDILNDEIIPANNVSGLEYRVTGLNPRGDELTIYTPRQKATYPLNDFQRQRLDLFNSNPNRYLDELIEEGSVQRMESLFPNDPDLFNYTVNDFTTRGLTKDQLLKTVGDRYNRVVGKTNIVEGPREWGVTTKPGLYRGDIPDITNKAYLRSIPGMQMSNTASGVFPTESIRIGEELIRGTRSYQSLNDYLKRLDLGRVSSGMNTQSPEAFSLWKNALEKGKATGFHGGQSSFNATLYQDGGMTVPGVNGTVVSSSLYDKKKQYKSGGQHGGLDRWFAEKWVDVKTGKQCGRQKGENRAYPACRPSKRVSSKTPKTSSELSSKEKAKFKAAKTSSTRIPYNHKRKK